MNNLIFKTIILILFFATISSQAQNSNYSWLDSSLKNTSPLSEIISVPTGFIRVKSARNSFAAWLRNLPVKLENNNVYLFDGNLKRNQKAQFKVLAIDVGKYDLQQCADAIIRLRAEYFYFQHAYNKIAFNFTSGDRAFYSKWIEGFRPIVKGNKVKWKREAQKDSSYKNFRAYLNIVFTYAGSYSLSQELKRVKDISQIKTGDVFIHGGFPGHAIIVLDVAVNDISKQKAILLAQSYMPAQEIHVLVNPGKKVISPWYVVKETDLLNTPEWSDLRRFE